MATLISRFRDSHEIEVIEEAGSNPRSRYRILEKLPKAWRSVAVQETKWISNKSLRTTTWLRFMLLNPQHRVQISAYSECFDAYWLSSVGWFFSEYTASKFLTGNIFLNRTLKTRLRDLTPGFMDGLWTRLESSPLGERLLRGSFWSRTGNVCLPRPGLGGGHSGGSHLGQSGVRRVGHHPKHGRDAGAHLPGSEWGPRLRNTLPNCAITNQ